MTRTTGFISVLDHDTVETSNLARQILHTDERVGMNKARSAAVAANAINPHIHLNPIEDSLAVTNAVALIKQHDLVLDCTDNVLTRYLISDAAVQCGRQVVSGAAQGLDGQLVTLHKDLTPGARASGLSATEASGEKRPRGPCYRCLFPKAPRPEDVTDCEDGGVLGTVTGLVGTMQALEAIKLLVGLGDEDEPPSMTLVSPLSFPPSRTVKLRPRRVQTCRACGDPTQMTLEAASSMLPVELASEDYIAFCGLADPKRLSGFTEACAKELATGSDRRLILDVRPEVEFAIAHLPNSQSMPWRQIDADPSGFYQQIIGWHRDDQGPRVFVVCRRGNDSRLACHALSAAAAAHDSQASPKRPLKFVNVKGGLRAWSTEVDSSFPVY